MWKILNLNPISKSWIENFCEKNQYYLQNHHAPIVSAEIYDRVQEIRKRRNRGGNTVENTVENNNGKREKYSCK